MTQNRRCRCWIRWDLRTIRSDKNTIHIYERLDESAAVNMELAKAGVSVRGIGITSEELENYFLNLTGGACNA